MFTKTACLKFALAPLAAATILSNLASASPAPDLQVRGDYPPPNPTNNNWPKKDHDCDCDFGWDKDHAPRITQPNKDTVWKVGTRQKVTWEFKWGDKKDGGYSDGKDWQHGKDGKDWHDGNDGKDWDDGKKCQWGDDKDKHEKCKTRLFLRKGDELPFLILAEGSDIRSGSVDVVVPNVFPGNDYRVVLSVRDDKSELQVNSEKFKIVKGRKDWDGCKDGKDCKDHDWDGCKDGKDKYGKECKDWNNGNHDGY